MDEPYGNEPEESHVSVLLLAAGSGAGFARSRWLEAWGATTVLEHAVALVKEWHAGEIVLVLGEAADEIVEGCDLDVGAVVIDIEWEEGPSSWLRAGLDTLTRQGSRGPVVVADAAMPMVPGDVASALLAAHDPEKAPVTVPRYRYVTAAPFVVDVELWPRLMGREGGGDFDDVWKAHPDWVHEVLLERVPPRAIRTPSDLAELRPR